MNIFCKNVFKTNGRHLKISRIVVANVIAQVQVNFMASDTISRKGFTLYKSCRANQSASIDETIPVPICHGSIK